ncbi:hypothetical protein CTKZ_23230 [Cellulomonas algicola]|uniref:Uncharacterized protein n=1 Tax=Cellulomonas algicola TaxID=2071633 RepID=A0A401V1H5_9CELL|nr:hypothetical protein [Cellulomonas algicola]GCD20761.1 hypothetical protein CTKZ_23230 [Cellulomonas algicola]
MSAQPPVVSPDGTDAPDGTDGTDAADGPDVAGCPDATDGGAAAGTSATPDHLAALRPETRAVTFVRSAQRWLLAYPPSWRTRHGAELVDVLADLAEPSATRVDTRTAAGLVVGGLRTRWRTGPPPAARLAFWVFDTPPSARYGDWLRDTVAARRFRVMRWLRGCTPALLLLAVPGVRDDPRSVVALVAPGVALYGVLVLLTNGERTRRWMTQRFVASRGPEPGTRLPVVVLPRQRVAAVPSTVAALVVVGVGAVAWSVAGWLVPSVVTWVSCPTDGLPVVACAENVTMPRTSPTGWLVTLAVSCVVGGLLALGAWRRLRRVLPSLPDQPWREVVPLVRTAPVGVAVVAAAIVASAAWEVVGIGVLTFSAVAAPVCVAALPVLLVLRRAARRTAHLTDVAAVDLWAVVLRGRPPRVDEPQPGLV